MANALGLGSNSFRFEPIPQHLMKKTYISPLVKKVSPMYFFHVTYAKGPRTY